MSTYALELNCTIEEYSENAIALFGDTKPLSNRLTAIGGKFNPVLKGINDQRRAGWIFSKKKRADLEQLLSQVKVEMQNGTFIAAVSKPSSTITEDKTSSTSNVNLSALLSRLELLETEVVNLKRIVLKDTAASASKAKPVSSSKSKEWADEDESESEEEKVVAPPKRLLTSLKAKK